MTCFAQHLSRGGPGPQRRVLAAVAILATLVPAQAEAITLRQYFADLTDRDRGVYLTGFMDLLRSDPQRETEFLECVRREGLQRMHSVLTDMVRQEPAILTSEVAPWFFYAAHRLCPQAGMLPRPGEAPAGGETPLPPQVGAEMAPAIEGWAVPASIGLIGLAGIAAMALLWRRRSGAPAKPDHDVPRA